jgi:hypothetical protein
MKSFAAILVVAAMAASPSTAGEIGKRAAEAERLLQSGDAAGALEEFRGAEDALWQAMPLAVKNIRHVESAEGVGIYVERASHAYRPGEKIVLYMEPIGYGYGSDGLGNSVIALSVDLTVFTQSGESLGTVENISQIRLASHTRNRELFFKLHLTLEQDSLPAGKYRAEFVMHDANSDKKATFSTDFEITG